MKPFKNCFAVDIDFSLTGYKYALEEAVIKNKLKVDTIYISTAASKNEREKTPRQWTEYVLEYIGIGLNAPKIVEVPEYSYGQWSLGTEDDYGYGSLGS